MMTENQVKVDDIASILFSTTQDLNAAFPALSARKLGMQFTPLLCFNEINVPGGLARCIRVLMMVNTDLLQQEIKPVYLNRATQLRPDITAA